MLAIAGAVPSHHSLLYHGGSENLMARWDRFVGTARPYLATADLSDSRIWRFVSAAGIFDDVPVAGILRMSRTKQGQCHPLAILASGATPAPGDHWFGAAAQLASNAVEEMRSVDDTLDGMRKLPTVMSTVSVTTAAQFWIEDWEIHELHFDTIHDLAAHGFATMLAPRPVPEDL